MSMFHIHVYKTSKNITVQPKERTAQPLRLDFQPHLHWIHAWQETFSALFPSLKIQF